MKARSIDINSLVASPDEVMGQDIAPNAVSLLSLMSLPPRISGTSGDYLLVPEDKPLSRPQRLLVLLPAADVDVAELGVKIGKIALPGRMSILFLALATDPELDSTVRRRLNTLTCLARDRQVETSAQIIYQDNWTLALERVLSDGDLLVCLAGQRLPRLFFPGQVLADRLVAALRVPVYVLAGVHVDQESAMRGGWRNLLVWVLAIAVIVLFGLFQALIERNLGGFLSTLVISISVIVETYVIWKLNFLG